MGKRSRDSQGFSDIVGEPSPNLPKERLRLTAGPDDQDAAHDAAGVDEARRVEPEPPKPEPEPLNATEEQCCAEVAAILLEDAEKDLGRRYKAGVRLLQEYPARIQTRGREVIAQAASRCGINPSDLYRMRTFAKTFSSFETFVEKFPEVKTWSKTKEVLAQENKMKQAGTGDAQPDQAATARKAAAKEQQARDRAKKEFIQLLTDLRKQIKKVPLTRLMLEEAQDIEEAFEEIATALTPLVGPMKAIKSAIKKEKVSPDKATL
jgi:hypothetical protein